jgi:hypothetical protein
VRNPLLLSSAMTGRHVGRTDPPAHGSLRTRGVLIAAIALPVALSLPAAWYVYVPKPPPAVDDIGSVIRSYGFDPLTPPSQLRGPGAIYHIEGSSVRKVCEATADLLDGAVDESRTMDRSGNSSDNAQFSLSGSFIGALNGKLDGARVATIEYGMKNVVIREIPEATLGKIEHKLMSEKDCDDTVNALLSANKKVCSGYSSLSASLTYKVHFDLKSDISAQTKTAVANVIKEAIEEKSGSQISVQNAEEFSGEDLIYGILLSARCLRLDTSAEPPPRGSVPLLASSPKS